MLGLLPACAGALHAGHHSEARCTTPAGLLQLHERLQLPCALHRASLVRRQLLRSACTADACLRRYRPISVQAQGWLSPSPEAAGVSTACAMALQQQRCHGLRPSTARSKARRCSG